MTVSARTGAPGPAAPEAPLPGAAAPRWPALLPDVALAAALTVFAQLNLRLHIDGSTPFGAPWAATVCTFAATGVLALRRRAPLATALAVTAAVAGPQLVTVLTITLWGHFVPMLVAA